MSAKTDKKTISAVYIDQLKSEIDSKKSRKEVASGIGIDPATVTKHYNRTECINALLLKKYAQYFGVSADYLLGLTEQRAPNIDVAAICEYTGLSPEAVEALHKKKEALDEYNKKTQSEQFGALFKEDITLVEELTLREEQTKRDFFDFLNYIIEKDERFLYTSRINPQIDNRILHLNMLSNGLKDFAADPRLIKTNEKTATIYYQRGKNVFRDTADFYQRLLFACSEDFKKAVDNYSKESRKEMTESIKRCQKAILEFEKAKKGDETNGTN